MCVCGTLCALKFDQLTSQQQGGSPPPLTFQVRKDLLEYLWFPSVRPQQKFQPTEIHYKSLHYYYYIIIIFELTMVDNGIQLNQVWVTYSSEWKPSYFIRDYTSNAARPAGT